MSTMARTLDLPGFVRPGDGRPHTVCAVRRPTLLILALALLAGCATGNAKTTPTPKQPIAGLQTFLENPDPRHTTKHVTYDHTPPAGGSHWPAEEGGVYGWLRCGVYTEPVPNEFAVHSEEHGAVWLTYLPGASADDVAALTALAFGNSYVLVSPYPGQPGRFMASTWGAQLTVDTASDSRLKAFVTAYAGGGQGGEKGADCAHGTLPAAARAAQEKADR
jgi:hypothetical protein